MSFRADEAAESGAQAAIRWMTRSLPNGPKERAKETILALIEEHGPIVESYPVWHPLLVNGRSLEQQREEFIWTHPGNRHGYGDLDHTIYFKTAFLTCPYGGEAKIIKSVRDPYLHAEILQAPMYAEKVKAVLVTCDPMINEPRQQIGRAVQSMLLNWESAQMAESWKSMSYYFLGAPHGSRSSLFVDEKTGSAMKRIYEGLVEGGIFGPWYKKPRRPIKSTI